MFSILFELQIGVVLVRPVLQYVINRNLRVRYLRRSLVRIEDPHILSRYQHVLIICLHNNI